MQKEILMIAGPNGAGKTTAAITLIPNLPLIYEFINADEIARGLSPLHPETMALVASKLMIQRLRDLLAANKSFAFETTAAGTNYLKYLKQAQKQGYTFNLMFLWLDSPEQAIRRVAERVSQGGHNIPTEVIKRRYFAGLKNLLKYYLPLADSAMLIDNSPEEKFKVFARKNIDSSLEIEDIEIWEQIQKAANGSFRKI